MFVELFGQYYPYPIKINNGEHVRQYWTCKWALQICSNHVLYNHEIAAKLRKHDSVTLAAVCEWINSSYDGILNSITEENECLKFEIRIFSKQMHLKFCKSWAKNEAQYKLQCILLDKELLVPGNRFADRYIIRFMQYEMSKPHKGATSYEAEDGCESDDSAFSSSSHQIQSYKPLSQEFKDELIENLEQIIRTETECLQKENKLVATKFENLNESIKGIEAHQETMLSGRFRHLFQKIEMIKQLHEETFSKLVQLDSTVTESNALVYELHQKVDTLGRTVQQSYRNQRKEKKDVPSNDVKIKELLNLMKGEIDTPEYQELLELIKTLKMPSCLSSKDEQLRSGSSDKDLVSNLSDVDPEGTEMMDNVPMDLSQTRNYVSVHEDTRNYPSLSQLKDVENSLGIGEYENQRGQNDSFRNLDPNRPLSPTLQNALSEYEGDILTSDDETLERDVEMNPESSCRGTNGVLTCNIQKTNTCNNSVDHEDDGELQGYTNECKLNYAEAKKEPSQKTTKPEIKTMKIPFTEKFYSSEEVTQFLKHPKEEEETFDNVMAMNRRPDRENCSSECDTDVEITLKASGLQKSKPVIRTVEKALKADSPGTRLHGLDTIICVDISASMPNKVLEQIQATICCFLDIVEDIAIDVGLEENLGLVTFSKETQICVQLTNDYGKIRGAIENLKPSGTSPLHTALSLCRLELERNGHATCIHEHCIAPRIILFTDGRPTRDLQMDDSDSEYAPKDQQTLDDISSFVQQQMGSEGIQLLTVGTGRQTNKDFLERLAHLGGGQYHELDNITMLAKYFRDQFIVGKVIHEHRESGWKEDYKAELQRILNTNTFRLDNEDIERIEEFLLQSEELFDSEYPGLPKLGSRVQTKDGRCGTVVRHRKQNWIKIHFDENDEIMYFHFIPNANNNGLQIINLPRRQETCSTAYVGLLIYKYDRFNKIKGWGYLYDRTESGYLKVKWEDGSKDIVKANDLYKNDGYRSFDSMYVKET